MVDHPYAAFIPAATNVARPPPQKAPPTRPGQKPAAPAAPTAAQLQQARDVGRSAAIKMGSVIDEYNAQLTDWLLAFDEVFAAYGMALSMRQQTLEYAKKEREREAAISALVFGLLTAGAMRFLGNYIQYSYLPSKVQGVDFVQIAPNNWQIVPIEFSKFQASFFGGFTSDIGNAVVRRLNMPTPTRPNYDIDTPAGIELLKVDFKQNFNASYQEAVKELSGAMNWMNQGTEFGELWIADTGSVDAAYTAVFKRIDELRATWANDSQLFGKSPVRPNRTFLANQYERALWAFFVKGRAKTYWDEKKRTAGYPTGPGNDYFEIHKGGEVLAETVGKIIEEAVTDRMKLLNVVIAETVPGAVLQGGLIAQGESAPTVDVVDNVNTEYELNGITSWADAFLAHAPDEAKQKFTPEAKARDLSGFQSRK